MKFKRFILIKTEGKGDGEYYRIPIAPLVLLFLLLLVVIVGRKFWVHSESSPMVLKQEQLIKLKNDNRQLDSILHTLKKQMDTTEMNSQVIADRAEELRTKADLQETPDEPSQEKHETFSHKFMQSYTDTLTRFLDRTAHSTPSTIWQSLPTISPISSGVAIVIVKFGESFESFSGVKMRNKGITFASQKGTSVRSTAAGIVSTIGKDPQKGEFIVITHDFNVSTIYSHLATTLVRKGSRVKKGEPIGSVGESGWSVGPQLLYEITKNGKPVDPTLLVQEKL